MFDLEIDAGIARLTLQRESVNAISAGWLDEFRHLLDALGRGLEPAQSRRLHLNEITRQRVAAFLAGELS